MMNKKKHNSWVSNRIFNPNSKKGINLNYRNFLHVIKKVELEEAFKFILDPYDRRRQLYPFDMDEYYRSTVNPYHNLAHMMNKAVTSFVLFDCETDDIYSYDAVDIFEEIQSLILADIFHDAGHSGGAKPDEENIVQALKIFDSYCFNAQKEIPKDQQALVKSLIRITQFPFKENPTTFLEMIMRDSDLLSNFASPHFLYESVSCLFNEFKTQSLPSLTMKQHLLNQVNFISNVKFFTKSANAIFEKYYRNNLIKCLTVHAELH